MALSIHGDSVLRLSKLVRQVVAVGLRPIAAVLLALLVAVSTAGSRGQPAAFTNLVANPSFEREGVGGSPLNWRPVYSQGAPKLTWESPGLHSAHSVAIEGVTPEDNAEWVSTPIQLDRNTEYVVSVTFKCRSESGPPNLRVGRSNFYLPEVTSWTVWRGRFRSADLTETTVQLCLYHRKGQKVWWDNVTILPASRVVSLEAPPDATISTQPPPSLQWLGSRGNAYKVVLARDEQLSTGVIESLVHGSTCVPAGIDPGLWFWAVLPAEGDLDAYRYLTEVRSFVVTGPQVVESRDTTPPVVNDQWPRPDTTVHGTVQLAARFSDQGGLAETVLALDGVPVRADVKGDAYGRKASTVVSPTSGRHDMTARATDIAGHRVESTWSFYVDSDAPSVALIDDAGNLLFNGRPTFPIGIHDYDWKQHPDVLFNAGFTFVLSGGSLDWPSTAGLKLLLGSGAAIFKSTSIDALRLAFASGPMSHSANPALLGYWTDEVEGSKVDPEFVQRAHRLAKELDPNHPFLACVASANDYVLYGATADALFPDIYPVPNNPLTLVADLVDQACAVNKGRKPVWILTQAFDPSVARTGIPDDGKTYRPTGIEMRNMTYLAVNHGVKGICYWGSDSGKCCISRWPERFRELCALTTELRFLSPVLLGGRTLPTGVRVSPANSGLDIAAYRSGGRRYIIAVNTERHPVMVRLEGKPFEGADRAEVVFEDRVIQASGGLTDVFLPLAVHVYLLTP